jgi:hypothetical protein
LISLAWCFSLGQRFAEFLLSFLAVPSDRASGSTLTPVWNRFPARLIRVPTSRAPRQLSHSILSFARRDEAGSAQLTCCHNSPVAAAVLLLKLSAKSADLATARICALLGPATGVHDSGLGIAAQVHLCVQISGLRCRLSRVVALRIGRDKNLILFLI